MTSRYLKRLLVLAGVVLVAVTVSSFKPNKPRPLSVDEVPIAYWSWRTRVPSQAELEESFAPTHAKTLFLRAGQIDIDGDKIQRIRAVTGNLPPRVETHLVYNATRKFLADFEHVDIQTTAKTLGDNYKDDLKRANGDGANIQGFQLDFDIPNRLLPQYAMLLETLRRTLPRDTKISITGLPAWTASDDLALVLAQTDFWIPQFYGRDLPTHASERIPIASPSDVARSTARVRQFGKPFYAGLSAYGYAILYGKDGSLIELRGNIDPSAAASRDDLELIDRRSFDESGGPAETSYDFRATRDLVINGLTVRSGETLMLDIPNSAVLRAEAKAVRENAGDLLLGICMFRIPVADDRMLLGPAEIAAALADEETKASTVISAFAKNGRVILQAKNNGTASSAVGDDAFTIDIDVIPGSVSKIAKLGGFTKYETLCSRGGDKSSLQPCSMARANIVRLMTSNWRPDMSASTELEIRGGLPQRLSGELTTHVDDGRVERQLMDVQIRGAK